MQTSQQQKWDVPVTLTVEADTAEAAMVVVCDLLGDRVQFADDPVQSDEDVEWCPKCNSSQSIVGSDSIPSMLGYGSDDTVQLACGHVVGWDPFTGDPMVVGTAKQRSCSYCTNGYHDRCSGRARQGRGGPFVPCACDHRKSA